MLTVGILYPAVDCRIGTLYIYVFPRMGLLYAMRGLSALSVLTVGHVRRSAICEMGSRRIPRISFYESRL